MRNMSIGRYIRPVHRKPQFHIKRCLRRPKRDLSFRGLDIRHHLSPNCVIDLMKFPSKSQ